MIEIITHDSKRIYIIFQFELRDPLTVGDYVRAYCHIHGSDHQRSLSVQRSSGWGHCFNAACGAVVLVAEWNPSVAARLLHRHEPGDALSVPLSPRALPQRLPLAVQPMLLHV